MRSSCSKAPCKTNSSIWASIRSKIEIVLHGTDLPVIDEHQPREGVLFFGGHHPLKGKGLHAVFQAMALLKTRLGPQAPGLKVHGYFSAEDLAAVQDLAAQAGLGNDVVWLNQISMPEVIRQYQSSLLCVLPFMGSFAGLAAATAAAVGLPVIATKNAGIPEHIGENGIWIENDNAEEIAGNIEKLLSSEELRRDLSRSLRKRAQECLSWDVVAGDTLAVYEKALRRKMDRDFGQPSSNPSTRNGGLGPEDHVAEDWEPKLAGEPSLAEAAAE